MQPSRWIPWLLAAVLACGSSDNASVCSPGTEATCRCGDGARGTAQCASDGATYGACECASGAGGSSSEGGNTSNGGSGGGLSGGGGASSCTGGGHVDTESPWSTHLDTTMANWVYPGTVRLDTAGHAIVLSRLEGSDFGDGPIQGFGLFTYDADGTLLRRSVHPDVSVDGHGDFAVGAPDQIYLVSAGKDLGCGVPTVNASIARLDAEGNCIFQNIYGDGMTQLFSVGGVAVDPEGNLLVSLYFTAGVDFGDGPEPEADLAVLELDPTGHKVWLRRFHAHPTSPTGTVGPIATSANGEIGFAMSAASIDVGQGEVQGTSPRSLFVGKLDAKGASLRTLPLAVSDSELSGLAMDACGGIALSAVTRGTPDFGKGPVQLDSNHIHVALASYAPNLGVRFVDFFQGIYPFRIGDVSVAPNGSSYLVGVLSTPTDFAGVSISPSGGQAFVAHFDAQGRGLSGRNWPNAQEGTALVVDAAGSPIISGLFGSGVDFGQGQIVSGGSGNSGDTFVARLSP